MPHRLCLSHLTLIELAPPQMVDAAADAGFDQVSLRLAPASAQEVPYPMLGAGGTPMMRETLARLRDRGVTVHDVEMISLAGHTQVATLEPLVAAAAELGARHILVAGDDDNEAALTERLGELNALGQRYGVRMALEFMPWRGIKTLPSALRVVQAAGGGGVIVDAIHLDRSGGHASEIATIGPAHWGYFQICDAPAARPTTLDDLLFQARQARLPPGRGGLDLIGMAQAIPADSVVAIEIPMHGLPPVLPPVERARMLRQATLQLLERARG